MKHPTVIATQTEMAAAIRDYRQVLILNGHKPTTQDSRVAIAYLQHAKTMKALAALKPKTR